MDNKVNMCATEGECSRQYVPNNMPDSHNCICVSGHCFVFLFLFVFLIII